MNNYALWWQRPQVQVLSRRPYRVFLTDIRNTRYFCLFLRSATKSLSHFAICVIIFIYRQSQISIHHQLCLMFSSFLLIPHPRNTPQMPVIIDIYFLRTFIDSCSSHNSVSITTALIFIPFISNFEGWRLFFYLPSNI